MYFLQNECLVRCFATDATKCSTFNIFTNLKTFSFMYQKFQSKYSMKILSKCNVEKGTLLFRQEYPLFCEKFGRQIRKTFLFSSRLPFNITKRNICLRIIAFIRIILCIRIIFIITFNNLYVLIKQ